VVIVVDVEDGGATTAGACVVVCSVVVVVVRVGPSEQAATRPAALNSITDTANLAHFVRLMW
jgi:hypothetical protein